MKKGTEVIGKIDTILMNHTCKNGKVKSLVLGEQKPSIKGKDGVWRGQGSQIAHYTKGMKIGDKIVF